LACYQTDYQRSCTSHKKTLADIMIAHHRGTPARVSIALEHRSAQRFNLLVCSS
jgi:hypothetical protein